MYICLYVLCVYMFIYAKVRFKYLEKDYLYMFSDLVHFRLVSFLEKFYIFRRGKRKIRRGKRRRRGEEEKEEEKKKGIEEKKKK